MKSLTTPDFWKAYSDLSPELKQSVKRAYQLWKENSLHPSLHFKKVGKNLWSVRITNDYYDLHELKGDRQGTWSIKVSGNWRITFSFGDGEVYDVNLEDYH
jgi:Plasmid maintenance system killer protein